MSLVCFFIFLAIIATFFIKKRKVIPIANHKQSWIRTKNGATPQYQGSQKGIERMVSCVKCELYIPASESICQNGLTYCSKEHAC